MIQRILCVLVLLLVPVAAVVEAAPQGQIAWAAPLTVMYGVMV